MCVYIHVTMLYIHVTVLYIHINCVYISDGTVCVCMCMLRSSQSYQLYLTSPTPVVPAAVDRFDIEVLSLANTSSVDITFCVSTPRASKLVLLQSIICMSLSSLVQRAHTHVGAVPSVFT